MLANYHTHTIRCGHARGSDREYVEAAIKGGFKVLGFADHCPWAFKGYVSGMRVAESDVFEYFDSLTRLKEEYAKDIKIYIGFEAEYIPALMEGQDRLLADYPLDYMILGEHFYEPEYIGDYTALPSRDEGKFTKYIDSIIEGMESGRYAYVAHPDLLQFIGDDEVYDAQYRRLCEYLKAKDIPIEINVLGTCGGRHYTSEKFLKIAQSVGNSAILGVDAHEPDALLDKESIRYCERLAEKFGLPLVEYLPDLGI